MTDINQKEREFELSKKIRRINDSLSINVIYVKEFIKRLKEEIENGEQSGYINDEQIDLREIIDKLAGKSLI